MDPLFFPLSLFWLLSLSTSPPPPLPSSSAVTHLWDLSFKYRANTYLLACRFDASVGGEMKEISLTLKLPFF